MGKTDRMLRLAVALVLIILYFTGVLQGTLAIIAWIIAAAFVITSMVHYCPLYVPFGLNTCSAAERNDEKS